MLFEHRYKGSSAVTADSETMGLKFAPDALREPTFFVGGLHDKLTFREGISALHHVVLADFKFRPSNKEEYLTWLKGQEKIWLAEAMDGKDDLERRIVEIKNDLQLLRGERSKITAPFYKAQKEYFAYLYKRDMASWMVLDPVITVHPDQLFFECFSIDESVYGKLSCSLDVFKNIDAFECGTTNIDYSRALYDEFQKIRSYKHTDFVIDPKGFDVQTGKDDPFREVKIDLPDSWMRGFLQVSSAMIIDRVSFTLAPADIANFIYVLKRNKEREGPRSIRYRLKKGQPVQAVFEPWGITVDCPTSIYDGPEDREIRVWGRRRLRLLERLLPVAKKFTVTLLGDGMPSFYIADLGDMDFTLGLSGWSANDWTSASRLDLLAPSGLVEPKEMQKVYLHLRKTWKASSAQLAYELDMDKRKVELCLRKFTQAGKVIYDLSNEVYRVRELKKDGVDIEALRFSSEAERKAFEYVEKGAVQVVGPHYDDKGAVISGFVEHRQCSITIDKDERLTDGRCSCSYYYENRLKKGPCEHMLALRFSEQNERTRKETARFE